MELRRDAKRVRPGVGTWIRSKQVAKVLGPPDPLQLASLADHRGEILAWGLYSPESEIPLRVLSAGPDAPASSWLVDRLAAAFAAREQLDLDGTTGYREVNSEGDGLPGLVIDRYGAARVVQITTAPMAAREPEILAWLEDHTPGEAIVVRPEQAASREGFEPGVRSGPRKHLDFLECGLSIRANAPPSQKTGAYHDQRENRRRFAGLAASAGGPMLDLGCHLGGFSLHASRAGASCVAVDRSEAALAGAAANASLNHLESIEFVRADMFRSLDQSQLAGPFGSIVFDPPKMAQSSRDLTRARNALSLSVEQLLPRVLVGGFFALCSCSHHLDGESLDQAVLRACRGLMGGPHWSRIARWGPGEDHPVAPAHPEGTYLRVHVYQRRW
jgi:23S rRNA (cytosine1962-C5)-methyltransferase